MFPWKHFFSMKWERNKEIKKRVHEAWLQWQNNFFLSIYPIEFKTLFYQPTPWMKFLLILYSTISVCVQVCCGDEEGGDESEFGTKASFQVSLCHLAAHKLMMFPQHDTEQSWATKLGAPSSSSLSLSFFWVWLQFCATKGLQVIFPTTKPTTISLHHIWFCRVDSGSVWHLSLEHSKSPQPS
jgi:hypothetical protein